MGNQNKIDNNWLTEEYNDYLNRIKEAVRKLYVENQHEDLPHFTPHGEKHCEAVEKLIYHITDNKNRDVSKGLNEKERFCLVASAWLHDLGMLPSIFKIIYPEVTPSPSLIREKHHITSSKFIVEHYSRCGVEEKDKELLAKICYFHRKRVKLSNCEKEFIVGFHQDENVIKLRLLAAYLRLADALHVDISRAPDPNYNICLTYSIPPDSKVHWIKSQVVNGIAIDCEKHLITVSFKIPHFEVSESNKQPYEFKEKLESIIRLVMNSLHEELNSVLNVLLDYNITYFIDIIESRQPVHMSKQMKNDLNELVLNYDIMEHPSASKLLEMTIETIANIAGFNIKSDEEPKRFRSEHEISYDEVKSTVNNKFLSKLKKDVKRTRPCHKGIDNLIHSCHLIQKNSRSISEYVENLQKLFDQYKNAGKEIRANASKFFEKNFIGDNGIENKYSIILFGYSQSVINALCGFRDAIIEKKIPNLLKDFSGNPGSTIEAKYSDYFRFYICEGSPKTQVAFGNRLLYHDGSQYALALKRKNFRNLLIIPDIIVGNVIENEKRPIFLMVGANGFDNEYFMHSAGHGSIFKIIKESNIQNKIKTILVVSNHKKEKEEREGQQEKSERENADAGKNFDYGENIESCWFWIRDSEEATRQHTWLPRDEIILKDLFDKKIMFFNPREDKIKIDELDFIISNVDYHPIKDDNEEKQSDNMKNFHDKLKSRNDENEKELTHSH